METAEKNSDCSVFKDKRKCLSGGVHYWHLLHGQGKASSSPDTSQTTEVSTGSILEPTSHGAGGG